MTNDIVIKCHGILVGEQHIFGNLIIPRCQVAHERFSRALDRNKIKEAVIAFFKKSVYKGRECVDVVASIGTYRVDVGNIKEQL